MSNEKFFMTINGLHVAAEEYKEIRNPATEDIIGHMPVATKEQLDMAVGAARQAFESWKYTSEDIRKQACLDIAKVIETHSEELAELVTLETGKTMAGMGSRFEVGAAVAWAGAPASFDLASRIIKDDETGKTVLEREPLGVCASITPWNWPLMIAIWHIIPAIRTGNTVVIKPSPFTPLNTLRLIDLIADCVPPGVINIVSGGDDLGALISSHVDIDKIIFTGSIPTGKAIMRSAADTMKRLTLEMGGNDAGIVLPGTDPAPLAEGMFWGAFLNSGQTCAALKRLYVHRGDYEAVCKALAELAENIPMGDGMDENFVLGPLQNQKQFNIIKGLVEDAKTNGNEILTGGAPSEGKGYFYPITLIGGAKDGDRVVDEEQFGPILPIIIYDDIEEAIKNANRLEYGLAASVWGQDAKLAQKVGRKLEAGTVYYNKHADIAPDTPLGGVKQSGIGVEFGPEGLEAYTNIKIYNSAA